MKPLLFYLFSIFWAPLAVYRDYNILISANPLEKSARIRLYYPRLIAAVLNLSLLVTISILAILNVNLFANAGGKILAAMVIFLGSTLIRFISEAIGQYFLKNMAINNRIIKKISSPQAFWQQTLYGDSHPGCTTSEVNAIENHWPASPERNQSSLMDDEVILNQNTDSYQNSPASSGSPSADHNLLIENELIPDPERDTENFKTKFLRALYKTSAPKINADWVKNTAAIIVFLGLCMTAAFGLFSVSTLATPGEFLMDGWLANPWFSLTLLACSAAAISQIIIRFVKSDIVTPSGKLLDAAIKGQDILTKWNISLTPVDRDEPDDKLNGDIKLNSLARDRDVDMLEIKAPTIITNQAISPPEHEIDELLIHLKQITAVFTDKKLLRSLYSYQGCPIDANHFYPTGQPYLSEHHQTSEGYILQPHPIKSDLSILKELDRLPDLPKKRGWIRENSRKIREVLTHIAPTTSSLCAEFDPDFRPKISKWNRKSLIILSLVLLVMSTSTIFFIFAGWVPFESAPFVMIFAIGSGVISWLAGKKVLSHTSAGPYGEVATILGIVATVFTTLTILTTLTLLLYSSGITSFSSIPISFHSTLLPMLIGAGISLLLTACFIYKSYKYTASSQAETSLHRTDGKMVDRKSLFYQLTKGFLISIKILLIFGFLFLAFLTIAVLFNLSGIGGLNNLLTFAYNIIAQSLGEGGYGLGGNWLILFSISIFAFSIFSATLLTKNVLEKFPANAKDLKKSDGWQRAKIFSGQLLKLIVTASIMAALIFTNFLPGSHKELLIPFILITVIMPLFSGNANFGYLSANKQSRLQRANDWYNRIFGLTLLKKDTTNHLNIRLLVLRELRVATLMFALPFVFSAAANFSFNPTIFILMVGASVTMLTRGISLLTKSYNSRAALQSIENKPHSSSPLERAANLPTAERPSCSPTSSYILMSHRNGLCVETETKTPSRAHRDENTESKFNKPAKTENKRTAFDTNHRLFSPPSPSAPVPASISPPSRFQLPQQAMDLKYDFNGP